jgi:GTP cyclohydrolase II
LIPAFALFDAPAANELTDLPLMHLSAQDALEELAESRPLAPVAAARLPIEACDMTLLRVFRDADGLHEHYAIEVGTPDFSKPVLTRLHSACFTGDVLGSLKCDCGPQLNASLARMAEEGAGLLLYLNQEGRGIGLANKMRVYDLQSKGLDTVQANHQLGFEDDERDFRLAGTILRQLGVSDIRLLTNNPNKERMLKLCGITITDRVPLRVGQNIHNQGYLSIKALKSGHFL